MEVNSTKAYASAQQKTLLLEFIKKNSRLASGKFSPEFTQKDSQVLWQQLTNLLNSTTGARKEWRKTWQDIRSRTKSKNSQYKRHLSETGGGPYVENSQTNFEKEVFETIKLVSVEGHTNVSESFCDFEIDEPQPITYEVDKELDDENVVLHNIGAIKNSPVIQGNNSVPVATVIRPPAITPEIKSFPRTPSKKLIYASEASENYRISLEKKNKI